MQLKNDKKLCKQISKNNQEMSKKYDIKIVKDQLAEIYKDLGL